MICNAGTLGILIPPSIVMVVYGAATETSVGKLFMAGVVPGIVLGLMLMVGDLRARPHARTCRASRGRRCARSLSPGRDSLWGLMLIVIILGGIYGGIFTPTEAAAVAAVYAFFIAVFVYRDIGMKRRAARAGRRGQGDGDADVHHRQRAAVRPRADDRAHPAGDRRARSSRWGMPPWQFLIVVNILLLVAGMFMEPTGIILILAPILFPIASRLGIDPVHLGIIMVVNLEIGMVTPPVGLNLFVTAGITGCRSRRSCARRCRGRWCCSCSW